MPTKSKPLANQEFADDIKLWLQEQKSREILRLLMQVGARDIVAAYLEIGGFHHQHIRYLMGPTVLHRSPWADTLPNWLPEAIHRDRFESILSEHDEGLVGNLATPTEVMAYMYPATMDAPMQRDWVEVYLWAGNDVLTRHNRLPEGKTFWEHVDNSPISYHQIKNDYEQLARDIRRKVVQAAASRGIAKKQRMAQPSSDSYGDAATATGATPLLSTDRGQVLEEQIL
ncbi:MULTISPECIES: hypothetical protein [Trichocoleus]|uniref:Uncharacterized protein n=1 Tax=Trichocoleus desertorum GB2-A4 TaxID=2933944 RepID=A0ABV0JH30_9CYAN|nr:hypothetical protein [Trichocoleus sp. FACHB-46]MBD1862372.1 hypothetical protein [Trichocoleus sp. FACHB-46]